LSLEHADGTGALREARRLLADGDADGALRWVLTVVDVSDELAAWSGAGAVLRRCMTDAEAAPRSIRVAVLGSSTTSQLCALLPLACARAGLQVELYEGAYGQYRQEILDPASGLYSFAPDAVVLAVHEGDLHLPVVSPDPEADLERSLGELESLWSLLAERSGASILQFTLVPAPEQPFGHLGTKLVGARHRMVQEFNLRMAERAPGSVTLVDCAHLAASVGTRTWFDAKYWHLAKQAVSPRCVPLLARHTGAVLAAASGASRKCLVLDLDNTLWGGVLGEDGLTGIRLGEGADGEAFTALQEYVLALKAKGIILAVCSKNDEDLVREAFTEHQGMRVRLEDIACLSAGWSDKAAQIEVIAETLGLGLESLVFLDDNPVEREVVRQLLPQVDVVRLPADPAGYVRALADYPYFETTALTGEDAERTAQYSARAAAGRSRSSASSLQEFLDSLAMEATVATASATSLPRVAQLVGKTNQFNLTTRRRSLSELQQLMARNDVWILTARLRDRFADHGLVGVVIAFQVDDVFVLDTLLMSCRVIGRSLEDELVALAATEARRRRCSALRGLYVPTEKNSLVAGLYARLGFRPGSDSTSSQQTWTYELGAPLSPPGHVRVVGNEATRKEGV
jgi:FkbH-like protein